MSAHLTIVDDDTYFVESLANFLQMRGFRVTSVPSSHELESLLTSQTPNLVILDVNLGRESGFSIASKLRSRYSNIGIIMLTALDTANDYLAGMSSGADIYHTKPINMRALEASILSVLQRSSA